MSPSNVNGHHHVEGCDGSRTLSCSALCDIQLLRSDVGEVPRRAARDFPHNETRASATLVSQNVRLVRGEKPCPSGVRASSKGVRCSDPANADWCVLHAVLKPRRVPSSSVSIPPVLSNYMRSWLFRRYDDEVEHPSAARALERRRFVQSRIVSMGP